MNVKLLRYWALCAGLLLVSGVITGCNQNQQQKNAPQQEFARGHHGLRVACGDDIRKYCPNEQRKRRCLRDNMDKLSDACKAALERRGNRNNAGGDNDSD